MSHRPNRSLRAVVAALAAVAVLALSGCGGGGDDAAQDSAPTPEGSVDIDPDGDGVTFTDEDGVTTRVGDGSLPEDWPADLTPPPSVTVVTSSTQSSTEETSMYVIGATEGSVAEAYAAIEAMLEAGGYGIDNQTLIDDAAAPYGAFLASKGPLEVSVTVAPGSDSDGAELSLLVTSPA